MSRGHADLLISPRTGLAPAQGLEPASDSGSVRVEEVRGLTLGSQASEALGYRQILDHLEGRMTPDEAVEQTTTIEHVVVVKRGGNEVTMADVPIDRVSEYACEDADVTCRLVELFRPRLEDEGLADLFHEVEIPLVPVLAEKFERLVVRDAGEGRRHPAKGLEDECATIYDEAGRSVAQVDALGNRTTTTYDGAGRRIAVTDANAGINT